MKYLRNIGILLLAAAMLLTTAACGTQDSDPKPDVTAAPVAEITPEPATPEPATPEPATPEPVTPEPEEPTPEAPVDVTGEWYNGYYGILQILKLNADGTYETRSPEVSDEAITGTWELQDGKIVLDGGWLYDPMVVEGETLVWNDLLDNQIVYTREKPDTGYTAGDPVTDLNDSAFLGTWNAKYITDGSGITFSLEALGMQMTIRINGDELVLETQGMDEEPKQLHLPYTIADGILTFRVDEDGTETVVHLTMQTDGNLAMTMEGEENESVIYILVPAE